MRRVGLVLVSAVLLVIGVLVVPAAAAAAPPAAPEPGAAAVTSPGGGFVGLPRATAFSGSIAAGATKRVTAQGVPGGAAAWLTLSVANPAAAGAVTVFTAAASVVPTAPNLVFVKGQTTSNSAVVPTSSAGALDCEIRRPRQLRCGSTLPATTRKEHRIRPACSDRWCRGWSPMP